MAGSCHVIVERWMVGGNWQVTKLRGKWRGKTHKPKLLYVWSFDGYFPSVHVGFLWDRWFPPTSKKHACRWTGYDKLPLRMNDCVYGAQAFHLECVPATHPMVKI